jgi:N-acyl-D-amino-acid deacylase
MKRLFLVILLLLPLLKISPAQTERYDLIIRNGRVIDGSGNPWVSTDIAINGDRIVKIGRFNNVNATRIIDAQGLTVAPGFIDMLGQSEYNLLIDPRAQSKIFQGITTEITGEGHSVVPVTDHIRKERDLKMDWQSLPEYFRRLKQSGAAINLATYVGATQVRRAVIGEEDRRPTAAELLEMRKLVAEAMSEGAFLIFAPGVYAQTDELIALAEEAARFGGIYATHIRGEADSIMSALDEAILIGRTAKIPVEIFHLKLGGRQNWGKMDRVIKKIEEARATGLDITANQYPYIATGTSLRASIPPWAQAGGTAKMIERLKDPMIRAKIKADIKPIFDNRGGGERILISNVSNAALKKYQGKRISEIARLMERTDEIDVLIDLLLADDAQTLAIYFGLNEDDVKLAMQQPWVSFCTDYEAIGIDGPFAEHRAHPRAYGAFARILGRYTRDEKVLKLEDAIRKLTSLPANRVGIKDRGLLKVGFYADIVIFDADKIQDQASFEEPNRLATGMQYVMVNGQLVMDQGKQLNSLPGRVLYHNGNR